MPDMARCWIRKHLCFIQICSVRLIMDLNFLIVFFWWYNESQHNKSLMTECQILLPHDTVSVRVLLESTTQIIWMDFNKRVYLQSRMQAIWKPWKIVQDYGVSNLGVCMRQLVTSLGLKGQREGTENENWREQEMCRESNLIGVVNFSQSTATPWILQGRSPNSIFVTLILPTPASLPPRPPH